MAKYKLKDKVLIPAEIVEVHETLSGTWYKVEPMNCEPNDIDDEPYYSLAESAVVGKFEES